jgi:hypothetical protein
MWRKDHRERGWDNIVEEEKKTQHLVVLRLFLHANFPCITKLCVSFCTRTLPTSQSFASLSTRELSLRHKALRPFLHANSPCVSARELSLRHFVFLWRLRVSSDMRKNGRWDLGFWGRNPINEVIELVDGWYNTLQPEWNVRLWCLEFAVMDGNWTAPHPIQAIHIVPIHLHVFFPHLVSPIFNIFWLSTMKKK